MSSSVYVRSYFDSENLNFLMLIIAVMVIDDNVSVLDVVDVCLVGRLSSAVVFQKWV